MMSGMRNEPPISISSPREISHLAPVGQRTEHQQHGRGVVVHDRRCLGSGQLSQQIFDECIAIAALARGQIEFQIDWCGQRLHDGAHGFIRQHRAAEIGVQHRTGQVEDRTQP